MKSNVLYRFKFFFTSGAGALVPAAACAVLLLALFLPAVADAKAGLMVAKLIANVRSEPDIKASINWVLSPGNSFAVGERQGIWYPIFPVNAEKDAAPVGFVSAKVITPADSGATEVDWGDVRYVGKQIKYRLERTLKSSTGGTLKPGDRIKVGFLRDGWYAVFKGDTPVRSEGEALGYVQKDAVDLESDDARIRYAVRRIDVTATPEAGSKQVGVLSPGHRAQVGKQRSGMYALYRIDTIVQPGTPVWGYAWGPFLAAYPKNLEKAQMAGIDARKAEIAAEGKKREKAVEERKQELDAMEKAMQEMLDAPLATKTMYAGAVLNVRSEPDPKSLIVDNLEAGQPVIVGAAEGKWYPVFKVQEGKDPQRIGYVFGTYLQAEAPAEKEKEKPRKRKPGGADEVPIKITSKKMVFSENRNKITFSGDVKVVRLDVTLTSEELTAFLRPDGDSLTDTQDKIKKIVASGKVKVVMNNRNGNCDKLTYLVADSVILMEGNARLKDGPNLVQGSMIKFYLKENRSEVVGGDKPIEAIFFTPKNINN